MGRDLVPGRSYLAILPNKVDFNELIGYLTARQDDETIEDLIHGNVGLIGPTFSMWFGEDEELREFLEQDREEMGISKDNYLKCPIRVRVSSGRQVESLEAELKKHFPDIKTKRYFYR